MVILKFNRFLCLLLVFWVGSALGQSAFKNDQLRYAKVRTAYTEKENEVLNLLTKNEILPNQLEIYIRAYKKEKRLELWGKNKSDDSFLLITQVEVCFSSGELGPKRRKHDLQVPEGFYRINKFNPTSSNYLSLGINYPNKSDRILGEKGNLGGSISIHGGCISVGCLPITDNQMKLLYVIAVEAKNSGQKSIPITIFPTELTDENYVELQEEYATNSAFLELWEDLKQEYDHFRLGHQISNVKFLENGRHLLNSN